MLNYKQLYIILAVIINQCLPSAAVSLLYLEINGPGSVDEESTTPYTCTAYYSDNSHADVTDLASWSIIGSVGTGVWTNDLTSAKNLSETYDIPLLYVWGSDTCDFCDDLETYIARSAFGDWSAGRQLVMAYVQASSIDSSTAKTFAKEGQNGTLYDYPFVAVYWPSKSNVVWNFTGRYTGDDEELQFINEIEHYISGYSSSPANCAYVTSGDFTAIAVPSNTVATISVSWNGFSTTKQVTILDIPESRGITEESFENGFGAWSDSSGNDFNWTRKSGPTISTGTGPSGAADGNYYIYTEASGNYPSKTAAIEGTVNVSAAVSPALLFNYHMYGADTGSLYVDVYDGSLWHLSVWSRSSQQHGYSSASWSEANVDLSAFSGSVTIRIRGVTADGYLSDMAVDNIRLVDASGIAPLSFEVWLVSESVPGGEQGESDDPANDGIANLLKYACGIPALQVSSTADLLDIVPGATPDVFAVRYYRDSTAVDVILEPIWAETLSGPWYTTGISKELIDADGTIQEWRGSIPLDQTGFIRLRATSVE